MGRYSIKEVESLSGLKAHTLRIWEQRYHILKPERTDTNIRYYTDEQLKLILNISTLNKRGMKISKIAGLSQKELNKLVEEISNEGGTPDVLQDGLLRSMIDFDEAQFEKTLSTAVVKHGFENAFIDLVFPLLIKAGILWSAGTIHASQEHFISNLIRRKISAAIDSQYVKPDEKTRKFVLFLPEGETHELVLLFIEYLLRKRNHNVAYIGNSVPYTDIEFIQQAFKPDYLVTFFSIPLTETSVPEYIESLSVSFPAQKLIIGGKQVENLINLPKNVILIHSAADLLEVIG